jgi:four helix bundle protein
MEGSIKAPIKSYRDLVVWQRAMDLVVESYQLTRDYPVSERYGLGSQTNRAAVSVAANIAEGHGRSSTGDYLRHLAIARGSLMELQTHFVIAERGLRGCGSSRAPHGSRDQRESPALRSHRVPQHSASLYHANCRLLTPESRILNPLRDVSKHSTISLLLRAVFGTILSLSRSDSKSVTNLQWGSQWLLKTTASMPSAGRP